MYYCKGEQHKSLPDDYDLAVKLTKSGVLVYIKRSGVKIALSFCGDTPAYSDYPNFHKKWCYDYSDLAGNSELMMGILCDVALIEATIKNVNDMLL